MSLYDNRFTKYWDFLFTELAGKFKALRNLWAHFPSWRNYVQISALTDFEKICVFSQITSNYTYLCKYVLNFGLTLPSTDHRTNHWPLISSPVPGLTIIGLYLYFVGSWGPKYMANRKPFKLERTLVIYNFLQVIVSTYLFVEGLDGAWLRKYNWRCEPVDFSETDEAMRVARGCYVYFLAKISELLDTVFFVLRKKERQISFLHMYHHTVMPMISWGATKYYPGGHGTFIGVINSWVNLIFNL